MTGAEWTAIGVALVAIAGNVILFIMGALKEKALKDADKKQAQDLERLKAELVASAAKIQRLETLQQNAIFELDAAFREAVSTAELFSKADYAEGFKNGDGHDPAYLIGVAWGGAYRKLEEKGLLFEPALAAGMRDVLSTIERIQDLTRKGNAHSSRPLSAGRKERGVFWAEAERLGRDELKAKWKKVQDDFQRLLGVDLQLDKGRRS